MPSVLRAQYEVVGTEREGVSDPTSNEITGHRKSMSALPDWTTGFTSRGYLGGKRRRDGRRLPLYIGVLASLSH